MERFKLTAKKTRTGKVDLVLGVYDTRADKPVLEVPVNYIGANAEHKTMALLRGLERPAALYNAEWAERPVNFDGSAKSIADHLFEHDYRLGECWLTHADGMRVAMLFALMGRCRTIRTAKDVQCGVADMPAEVVLYWFTLCFYGRRRKAGKAGLYSLLTTKEG